MLDFLNNPPTNFRPTATWFWNDKPDDNEIARQIREMHSKGIGGFIIRPESEDIKASVDHNWWQSYYNARQIALNFGLFFIENTDFGIVGNSKKVSELKETFFLYRQAGTKDISASIGNFADYNINLSDLKQMVDWQASLGANHFHLNAFYYSLSNIDIDKAYSSLFYQTPMWQHFSCFTDYSSRLSALLSQGKNNAQVAILKPKEYSKDKLSKLSGRYFEAYCEQLIKSHIDFNIIDNDALLNALTMDQKLIINDNEYKLLILPPLNSISYQSALNIFEFVEDGGQMVGTLYLPTKDDHHREHKGIQIIFSGLFQLDPKELQSDIKSLDNITDTSNKQIDSNVLFIRGINPEHDLKDIRTTLSNAIKPYVSLKWNEVECEDITFTHRTSDDFDIYFFSNNSPYPREVQMSIRCDKAPHTINLETGVITALANCTQIGSRTMLLHRFESYGSLLLYFCDEPALAVSLDMLCEGDSLDINSDWEFYLHNDNFLPLTSWHVNDNKQITEFNVSELPGKTLLVFQHYNPDSSITVNGSQIGNNTKTYIDNNFLCFDIVDNLKEGKNIIEIINSDTEMQKIWLAGIFKVDKETNTLTSLENDTITGDWSKSNYPYFSGTASYKKTISIENLAPGRRVMLCVEQMRDIAEFFVNGEHVGTRAWGPYTADITNSINIGKNNFEIRVTNTMANMIQDKAVPSGILGDISIIFR